MVRRGSFIGGQDNLSVPDAPTIGAATVGAGQVSVAFTAPSDVGDDAITGYGASATDGTNVIGGTGSSSPVTISGLTNGTSYTAQVWAINDYGNGPLSAATSSFSPVAASVGLLMGGHDGSGPVNIVDKIIPETAGNATDFGDLSAASYVGAGCSSDTRAIYAGGYGSANRNEIEYFTFSSAGNATDFGDLSSASAFQYGLSNNVRGVIGLAYISSNSDTLEYITIATTGNTIDFGNVSTATYNLDTVASSTRGVVAGGYTSSHVNTIEYITIASASNATDFGDLTVGRQYPGGASNNTRGIFFAGSTGSYLDTIDYITIASAGNATDFGDASVASDGYGGVANSTKGVFGGRRASAGYQNVIEQVTIATTADSTDFGDLTGTRAFAASACSGTESVQNESYFAPAAMGLFFGGDYSNVANFEQTTISYIDIATTGRLAMFGDLSAPRDNTSGGFASSTRGGIMGGQGADNTTNVDIIEYVLFSTKGKATDFGNLTAATDDCVSTGNSTRGLVAGGDSGSATDTIEYITIASAGNATDFGNLLAAKLGLSATSGTTRAIFAADNTGNSNVIQYVTVASTGNATDFGDTRFANSGIHFTNAAASNSTRGVFGGGTTPSAQVDIMYVTIATTGNASDFGDLTSTKYQGAGASDAHGGLG